MSLLVLPLWNSCIGIEPDPEPEPEPEMPFLECGTDTLKFGPEGGTVDFPVSSNCRLSVESQPEWIKAYVGSSEENGFRIIVKVSPFASGREGIIVISAPECEEIVIPVIQSRRLSSSCSLRSFSLKMICNPALKHDIEFSFDADGTRLSAKYLKWIDAQEPWKLVPSVDFDGAELRVSGQPVTGGKDAVDFSEDFVLSVVAENGDSRDYLISLNCPQINTELPVLHLKPTQQIYDKSTYVSTYITLYDRTPASAGTGWWDSAEKGNVEVRGRGNSTWGLPKKPYRLKFPEKYCPIGLDHDKAKSWVLLSQDMDKSLIRTHIAFAYSRVLFNKEEGWHDPSAVLFTPCSRFINVYMTGPYYDSSERRTIQMDGDYLGLYQMSDQMERSGGRIAVDKLGAADGSDPDKISGGYVIETDLHEGNFYSSRKGIKMTYKYPEDDDYDPSQYSYISDFIDNAERVLYSSSYTDASKGWRSCFDEKTLVDFIIIKELVGDLDGYTSTYMYKRRGVDKLFFGPIWDCDKGWNNDRRVPHYEYVPLESLMIKAGFWMPPYVENDWFWRFWSDPSLRSAVNSRWQAKKGELLAVTEQILNELPAAMEKSIEANFTRWPFYYQYSNEANMPASTYAAEVERIRELTVRRAALLDKLFSE